MIPLSLRSLRMLALCAALCSTTIVRAQDSGAAVPNAPAVDAEATAVSANPSARAVASDATGSPDVSAAATPSASPASESSEDRPQRYEPTVVGKASARGSAGQSESDGPGLWSAHRKKPAHHEGPSVEEWFIEAGAGLTAHRTDAFTRQLGKVDTFPFTVHAAVGMKIKRSWLWVSRYDLLGVNDLDPAKWQTHGVSTGLRGVLAVSRDLHFFGETTVGFALAHLTVDVEDEEGESEKRSSEEVAPLVRVAAGLTWGQRRVGGILALTYVHASPLEDFGAVHNDGGVGGLVGFRVRGWE